MKQSGIAYLLRFKVMLILEHGMILLSQMLRVMLLGIQFNIHLMVD